MKHLLRAASIVVLCGATSALACYRGEHGHVGAGPLSIHLGVLQLLTLDLSVHTHDHLPCPEVMATAPRAIVEEGPSLIALKYLPGVAGQLAFSNSVGLNGIAPAHSLGLEVRLSRYFALRSDLELRDTGRSWDFIGGKVTAYPSAALSPYASVSLSGTDSSAQVGHLLIGLTGAAGLDLKLGRHFFLEAEARYRVAPDACCRDVPQLIALVGGGLAFF